MIHDNNWFHRMRRGEVPRAAVSELLQEAFETVDVQSGQLRMQVTAAQAFCNPAGGVQGGMLSAMLDAATAGVVDATLLPDQVPRLGAQQKPSWRKYLESCECLRRRHGARS